MSTAKETLEPKDFAEAVALFRAEIIGALTRRQLARGELARELRALSKQHWRPPGSAILTTYAVPTLERWYYAYRQSGLLALRPEPRADRGHARALTPEQRELLCDIRREHPRAATPLILATLDAEGQLDKDQVSASSVNRLFRDQGLDRVTLRPPQDSHTRLRWQADKPNALWHADVCHGPNLIINGQSRPLRIHALLDDCSRFVVDLRVFHSEREQDMLELLVGALRRVGAPDVLYLDNGATYRGHTLRLCCERLGITLLHAAPYDPQARGKMERFWRTLRQQCLDFLGSVTSLHEVQVRLLAYLDQHYHKSAHASLLGRSPGMVFAEALDTTPKDAAHTLTEAQLRDALTVRQRRRLSRDNVLSLDGQRWQTDRGFLAGQVVTIAYSLLQRTPWLEHQGTQHPLTAVDPIANGVTSRQPLPPTPPRNAVPFDPPTTRLNQWLGRSPAQTPDPDQERLDRSPAQTPDPDEELF
jgi:transposase InsO family protein